MNYLAHTLLSTKHIDFQVANVLADMLKGKPWDGCSSQHILGLNMHKFIDLYTDNHPLINNAKAQLKKGYLRGIVIDIFFDHMLFKHWDLFVYISFDDFVNQFYTGAKQSLKELPETGKKFINRLVKYDFFHLYVSLNTLEHVFEKFDLRLSTKLLSKDSTVSYLPSIVNNYSVLEELFLRFFPDLVSAFFLEVKRLDGDCFFKQKNKSK